MSEPVSKRRKIEATDLEAVPFKRSESFWLEDGNVILQAEGTQFRVHRSVLSRQSTVFKDMFTACQAEEPDPPAVEGCPVVFLSDRPDDVEHILSIFYNHIRALDPRNELPISQAAAMLRLGKKYDIVSLRDEVLNRLRHDFSTTLEGWDTAIGDESLPTLDYLPSTSRVLATVICLGRELGIQTILPGAFLYYASNTTPEEILMGDPDKLPQEARIQCMLGRDRLMRSVHNMLHSWARDGAFMPQEACYSKGQCHTWKMRIIDHFNNAVWLSPLGKIWDLLGPIPKDPSETIKAHLCEACADSVKLCYEEARKELWADLPGFFGLPKWDQLKDFDS